MVGLAFQLCKSTAATALDDYVAIPDFDYFYAQIVIASFDFSTLTRDYVLELTSQNWRNSAEVDRVL